MDLLFFWGMKLWGIGAFKVLFYVIMIINIIFTVIWTIYCFATMEDDDSLLGGVLGGMSGAYDGGLSGGIFGGFLGGILGAIDGITSSTFTNYVNPISALILLIGYIASIFIFPNFGYPIKSVFWTLCILDCSVAVISLIGCLIGQKSFNGILYAIMDVIALINLNSLV